MGCLPSAKKAEREAELKAKFEAERRERMEKMAGANLYIKNLEDGADDETLRELFKEFGTITSCESCATRLAFPEVPRLSRFPLGRSHACGD